VEGAQKFDLGNLIPGLSHGLLGMKEGEIREIFIHPDFAYGVYSNFGNGKPLQINVELVKIEKDNDDFSRLPLLQPFDARNITPKIKTCNEYQELRRKYNYSCGMRAWQHYKKAGNLVDLDTVIRLIMSNYSLPSHEERVVISMLNWMIYQI
jgi:hypothetical protein